ncbi:unnamed protein product, partial [Ectocarpus sp. 12 AP-2014]
CRLTFLIRSKVSVSSNYHHAGYGGAAQHGNLEKRVRSQHDNSISFTNCCACGSTTVAVQQRIFSMVGEQQLCALPRM